MYQTGDKVFYGIHGVCAVVDRERRIVDRKEIVYLVLEPLTQQGARYLVPAHNEVAMRKLQPLLTRDAYDEMLSSDEIRADCWIHADSLRKQRYRELLGIADRKLLLQMLFSLHRYCKLQIAAGKKIHMCDDAFRQDAEKLLSSELSVILDVSVNDARQYLLDKIKEDA